MSENYKYIGKSLARHDAKEKANGSLKYTSDLHVEGLLYARLKTSEIAHGIIKSVDASEALEMEGVVGVYHSLNTPLLKYNEHQWMDEQQEIDDQSMFCDKARFHGDRIGVVVAVNAEVARRAVDKVKVEYEPLEIILTPEDAVVDGATKIHETDNLIFDKKIEIGDVDSCFENADRIFEDQIVTPKQHHAAMETHVCLAIPESNGHLTIITPCQVAFQVQLIVSKATGLPISKIRVIKANIGGSFGGKGQPNIESICAYAALQTKKPVLLETDRFQSIASTKTRHATMGTIRSVVDENGLIIARAVDILADTGAYCTNAKAVIMAMAKKYFRMYKIEHSRFSGKVVYTNTPIAGACRGYGSPQIHAITEIHMDNIAHALALDPVEMRLKNLIEPFDKDPLGGPALGNARVIDCVKLGAESFNWSERVNRPTSKGRFRSAVGMACATHGNGYFGAYPDFINMTLKMNTDGEVVLNGALHDLGCGTVTTMQQIVAEVLNINPYTVNVIEADTLVSPYDSAGTQASRVTYVCGGAAKQVAELLRAKLLKLASEKMGCDEKELCVAECKIMCKSNENQCLTYKELVNYAYQHKFEEVSVSTTYQSPANPGVYAANFVEVEVDTYTGLVSIKDFLAVHDIGRAINRDFVEGQIHGGVQMSLGMALMEELTFNAQGLLQNKNFNKYHIFNAPEMPRVKVMLIEAGEEGGPFGAKSVGEVCAVAAAPAVINAINHALGTRISELPATPERILRALDEKESLNIKGDIR